MDKLQLTQKKALEIIEIANFAPSVHNTQPWLIEVTDNTINVSLDPKHSLQDGDPTGRQTIISLGIFAEALKIAAQYCGFSCQIRYKNQSASIVLTGKTDKPANGSLVTYLKRRCSDRSIYKPHPLSDELKDSVEKASTKNVQVWLKTERPLVEKTAALTAQGISLALSSPGFRHELSQYLAEPWSKTKRGIAVDSLYIPKILALLEPFSMKMGLGLRTEARLEKRRWLSSSAVIFIAARGDMPEYWFETGAVYLNVALHVEKFGLSQATSAALVEASSFHEDIEDILKTNFRLQSVMRIGRGKKHRVYSPRVDAHKLIVTSN